MCPRVSVRPQPAGLTTAARLSAAAMGVRWVCIRPYATACCIVSPTYHPWDARPAAAPLHGLLYAPKPFCTAYSSQVIILLYHRRRDGSGCIVVPYVRVGLLHDLLCSLCTETSMCVAHTFDYMGRSRRRDGGHRNGMRNGFDSVSQHGSRVARQCRDGRGQPDPVANYVKYTTQPG